jgi:hypothetical protein
LWGIKNKIAGGSSSGIMFYTNFPENQSNVSKDDKGGRTESIDMSKALLFPLMQTKTK